MTDDKIEVEKLQCNNDWWEWKYNITLQLKAKKLWGHVEGTATLREDASKKAQQHFVRMRQMKIKKSLITMLYGHTLSL